MPVLGKVIVGTGPMFCGKSSSLIFYLKNAEVGRKRVIAFKPKTDTRTFGPGTEDKIVARVWDSKQGRSVPFLDFPAKIIASVEDMKRWIDLVQPEIIGIDEAQFLDPSFVEAIRDLCVSGVNFFLVGLDLDYLRNPFGETMPRLLALADIHHKTSGTCYRCGSMDACFTQKLRGSSNQTEVGDGDMYQPACRLCWYPYRGAS